MSPLKLTHPGRWQNWESKPVVSVKKVLFFSLCEMMWLERLNISQTWGSDLQSFTHLYPVSQFSFLSCITAKIRKDTQRMAEDNLMKAAVQWWCGHC